jgi:hypothetical protein
MRDWSRPDDAGWAASLLWRTAPLVCAGVAFVVAQLAVLRFTCGLSHQTATTVFAVLPLIAGLALPTALLLLLAPRLTWLEPARTALLIVFLAGLTLRAVWFGAAAPLEDDFQRYLWDGAVVASGLNPYGHAPEQVFGTAQIPAGYEAIAAAGRRTGEAISFPDLRTIYPSTAQASFALAHWIAPFSIDGLRLVFLAAEIATFLLLILWLRELDASPLWSVLYWWNPTVAYCLVGIAHVDALVPPFVLGALLMAHRGWSSVATALLAAAAGVKIWPLLLVPLVLMRGGKNPRRLGVAAVVSAVVLAAAIGPLLVSAIRPGSGLTAYASSWGNNNAFFAWTAYLLGGALGEDAGQRALGAVGTALTVALRAQPGASGLLSAGLTVAAVVFYLLPAQFPWYAAWFWPLAVLLRNWPLLLASATLPFYYLFYPFWAWGQGDAYFFGAAFLHSVPVLGWLVADQVRRLMATRKSL